jgi:DNA-directed RNA polymerase beta' subunit
MAAELYKPFIIRKLIERGIVKTVKSAKKIIDRKEPVVWDILENVLKGHPVLLKQPLHYTVWEFKLSSPSLLKGKRSNYTRLSVLLLMQILTEIKWLFTSH